jgi:hypothetical protein
MALTFPNNSRSYDETSRRIRFFGYDGMFEIRFFIEIDALAKAATRKISGEGDYLSAFDTVRKTVIAAAEKAYGRGARRNMYTLTLADF